MCGTFHEVRRSGKTLGKRGEIVAPAYTTRDFDLFNTGFRALSTIRP